MRTSQLIAAPIVVGRVLEAKLSVCVMSNRHVR
jgi:hypothetical protein